MRNRSRPASPTSHFGAGFVSAGSARLVHATSLGWHDVPMFEQTKLSPGFSRRQFTQVSVQARQSRSASGRLGFWPAFAASSCAIRTRDALSAAETQEPLTRMRIAQMRRACSVVRLRFRFVPAPPDTAAPCVAHAFVAPGFAGKLRRASSAASPRESWCCRAERSCEAKPGAQGGNRIVDDVIELKTFFEWLFSSVPVSVPSA